MCRGHDYERLEAFQQRMLNEFPHAIAMQHVNQPDQTIYQAEAQCILGRRPPSLPGAVSVPLKHAVTTGDGWPPVAVGNHRAPPTTRVGSVPSRPVPSSGTIWPFLHYLHGCMGRLMAYIRPLMSLPLISRLSVR